ncbi:uncharacterized protein LOC107363835 [Tetranychus urticae]|uniref:Uncharacterized protein n=1 Tax=Tetranychus urticae TaxID=32264 RepID=T1KGP6_TETUR|nr:uncharacterized protein LOC107363835 [Tetranychus urticae]
MLSVYIVPVLLSILCISQVYSADSKFPGYSHQILEIDFNTLRGLLAEEKLGDNVKRSSSVNPGSAALLPGNTGSQSPISLPSNNQYSSLPIPMYLRNPSPVKKPSCENSQKVLRTPLAAASSAVSATHYGLSSASVSPVPSAGQQSEIARNRYSTLTRTYADSAVKPVSNQTLSSQASVPVEYAKSAEIHSAETASNGASTVLAQAGYAAVSPNSHLAIAAPTSASGYDSGNMQALGQGASVAKLPGLKPLAIEENQKAAFQDFTGALENHEFKPLTNQDVYNLPVVSHSALTGGAVSAPQSQGAYKSYSNQGNNNYGASPNQGYMKQYNGYSEAAAPPSYNEAPAMSSSYGGLSDSQSYGGQYYGGANSAPSYGVSSNGPNTQSYGGAQNVGQYYNNAQSGVGQSYGYPSGSYESSDSQGWNSPLRAFIK